jgi:hypothetical protein
MSAEDPIALKDYPRAQASIARAKGLGGIGAFVLVGLVSLHAGVPFFDSGLRALVGGVVGYAVSWLCAVQIWRHVTRAQIARMQLEAFARRRAQMEEAEAARAEREARPA